MTVDFNSTVNHAPGRLHYPATPAGKKVTIAKGVTGTLVTTSNDHEVVWRYPTDGRPPVPPGGSHRHRDRDRGPRGHRARIARHVEPD